MKNNYSDFSKENTSDPDLSLLKSVLKGYHGFEPFQDLPDSSDKTYNNEPIGFSKNGVKLLDPEIALCVGAGITSYLVGDWRKLLDELLVIRCLHIAQKSVASNEEIIEGLNVTVDADHIRTYIQSLQSPFIADSTNPLEIGEYLMYDPEDKSPAVGTDSEPRYREKFFSEQVRHIIYSNMKNKTNGKSLEKYFKEKLHRRFAGKEKEIFEQKCWDEETENMATLYFVVRLCIKKSIKNIVSYNFDTILDHLLADESVRSLFVDTDQPDQKKKAVVNVYSYNMSKPHTFGSEECRNVINIYHVHGVLDEEIPVEPIIFSENSYQNYQKNILNWSNTQMFDIMRHHNVLCIGFSGSDPNFRFLRHSISGYESNPIVGGKSGKKLYLMRSCGSAIKNFLHVENAEENYDNAIISIKTYLEAVTTYFDTQLGTDIIWSDGYMETARQIFQLSEF